MFILIFRLQPTSHPRLQPLPLILLPKRPRLQIWPSSRADQSQNEPASAAWILMIASVLKTRKNRKNANQNPKKLISKRRLRDGGF